MMQSGARSHAVKIPWCAMFVFCGFEHEILLYEQTSAAAAEAVQAEGREQQSFDTGQIELERCCRNRSAGSDCRETFS